MSENKTNRRVKEMTRNRLITECISCGKILDSWEDKIYVCEECGNFVCEKCCDVVPVCIDGVWTNEIVCEDCANYLWAEYEERKLEEKARKEQEGENDE